MRKVFTIYLFCVLVAAQAQGVLEYKIKQEDVEKSLIDLFHQIESSNSIRFYYLADWISGVRVGRESIGLKLREVLEKSFTESDLSFIVVNDFAIVIVKDPAQSLRKNEVLSQAVNSGKRISKIKFGTENDFRPGKIIALSGTIVDQEKKPLAGVTVSVTNYSSGSSSDDRGEFKLNLPAGSHVIRFSYVNFEDKFTDLEAYVDGNLQIQLDESPQVLDDIVVVDKMSREITTSGIGQTQIIMKEVKRAPALLGEVDIIKQIQMTAGVTTVGEAASGYNVRGGSVDQNLILYDGLPVFNSSHVFGFFSTFNAEAISNVSFYRGGIPAEYGGRASSVLDIRSKEGDYSKWKFSGGIGLVSSNLLVEGPIKKDKTSIVASIRTTYSDWMLNAIKSNYVDLRNSEVKFYDDAIKFSHKFNNNTKLTYSWYNSNDRFKLNDDSTYVWNTKLNTLKLDRSFSEKLSGTLSLGLGEYQYRVVDDDKFSGFDLFYKLNYPSLKADFLFNSSNYKIFFGTQSIYYLFNPGSFTPNSPSSNRQDIQMQKQRSLESALYTSAQFYLSSKMFFDVGLRYSMFQSFGPQSINIYESGKAREISSLVDTLSFKDGQVIKPYHGFEPRVGLRYEMSPRASLKLGFNRLYQYLHLVTNTTAITPVDIWQPSGYYFKPQRADQISLGYFSNFQQKSYDAFIEGYYKIVDNVLDFKDGAQLILNKFLEADLLQGKSRSYGIETQLAKLTGRLTGSISYSYARSFRTIRGQFDGETINRGREYPSNFDQPHIVNLSWKFGFTRRHFFTGAFTYHTGRPITLPLNAYKIENITVTSFSERNKFRIPDYHRLDVGFVIEGNHKRKKLFDGTWTFSIYNAYGRRNPYTIFFKEVRPGILRPYRLAVIGTILPSISYTLKI